MRPGDRGFTLVEIIIASLLVTTVVSVLLAAFVTANRWMNPEYNIAHYLAKEQLERLYEQVRHDWWDNAATDPERRLNPGFNPPARSDETIAIGGVNYTRNYVVSDVGSASTADTPKDYRKVKVTVSW